MVGEQPAGAAGIAVVATTAGVHGRIPKAGGVGCSLLGVYAFAPEGAGAGGAGAVMVLATAGDRHVAGVVDGAWETQHGGAKVAGTAATEQQKRKAAWME